MRGVYSSCVGADPLDESSVAYKSTDCIVKEKDIRNFGYLFLCVWRPCGERVRNGEQIFRGRIARNFAACRR